jgi:xylulokinase
MMASLLAAGLTEVGQAVDVTGTAAMMCILGEKPVMNPRIQNLHHAMPGWVTFGIVEYGGVSLKWFKDEFCLVEILEGTRLNVSPYKLLDEKAEAVPPGSEGMLFYPYFLGERGLGSPYSRGVFFGLTPRSGRGAMARAIMEGIVFDMRRTLEIAEQGGVNVTQIRSVGGGAQSRLWCQIRADIYKKPIAVLETFEGGTLGSAILAGVAAGAYPNTSAAADRLVKVSQVIEPDLKASAVYDQQFEIFKDLHDRMMDPWQAMARVVSTAGA